MFNRIAFNGIVFNKIALTKFLFEYEDYLFLNTNEIKEKHCQLLHLLLKTLQIIQCMVYKKHNHLMNHLMKLCLKSHYKFYFHQQF